MINVFQHLDDPLPLPDCSREQRQAVMSRGASLRRRRRAWAIGVPAALVAVAASAVVAASSSQGEVLTPAAPAAPELALEEAAATTDPAYGACPDPEGDSVGEPDVTLFSLDRPMYPFVHFHWNTGPPPSEAVVELLFEATSADELRSRQLVARSIDGEVVEQFLRDPRTGARRDVPHTEQDDSERSLAAEFPGGALSGLGNRWTWVASLSLDGTVVDSCDPAEDPRNLVPDENATRN